MTEIDKQLDFYKTEFYLAVRSNNPKYAIHCIQEMKKLRSTKL